MLGTRVGAAMSVTFKTTIVQADDKNAAGIHVPPDVIAALRGGKKPPVKVTIGDYSYGTTGCFVYGGVFMIGVSQERRAAAGIAGGDEIEVTLELDTEPRTVDVPDNLAAALAQKPGAREAFDTASYSVRKEYVAPSQVGEGTGNPRSAHRGIVDKMSKA